MIKVLKAGFYSTVQDQGRYGYRNFGVPVSGVMDSYSGEFANRLLGNDIDCAVLEMTMIGAELQFLKPTTIVITGANMRPVLNGNAIEMFKSILVKANDIISFRHAEGGFRTYLAVKGGLLSDFVLGSRSMAKEITTTVKIAKNDIIEYSSFSNIVNQKNAKLKYNSSHFKTDILEASRGPEFHNLSKEQQLLICKQDFKISKYNNRMAYQLIPEFKNNLAPILTAPVLPGTVQLTPSGQLIVLMRDCQTTGGYPRIFQLTENSVNVLSQKATGNTLRIRLKG